MSRAITKLDPFGMQVRRDSKGYVVVDIPGQQPLAFVNHEALQDFAKALASLGGLHAAMNDPEQRARIPHCATRSRTQR